MIKTIKVVSSVLFLVLLSLIIIGFAYEQYARGQAEKQLSPLGKLVDVGGHKLHYYQSGNSGPTVVFESAFDPAGHLQWLVIQQQLADVATTISYDRAGLMWSERGNNEKSSHKMTQELYALLAQANAPKPYILVGHSLGGVILRQFVAQYPADVAGIVLVDSAHPEAQQFMSPALYEATNQKMPSGVLKAANQVGVLRLMFNNAFPDKPEYQYQNSVFPAMLYKSADAILEEQEFLARIYQEASAVTSFADIPLVVMSATDKNRFDNLFSDNALKNEMLSSWSEMQKDLLSLSSNSRQVLVANSSHYINEDQPEVIVSAIHSLLVAQ